MKTEFLTLDQLKQRDRRSTWAALGIAVLMVGAALTAVLVFA